MKRTLLFLFCALMSTQMFSETLFGYLFPTLAYLERTSCHYMEGNEQNRTLNRLSFEDNMFEIDGNYYIEYNDMWLREDKEGRIFVYSEPAKKDLVLYDFTLEVGDTLTTLNIDIVPMTEGDPILPGVKPVVVDYPIHLDEYVSFPIDTLIVTDVSMVMMCDSNQYKKWTFSNGMEYMEYIGNLGADFFAIIRNPWEELPTCCVEEDLVCASIYDRLVYLMDDEKRDLLNIDCPCTSWSNKWQWRTNTWNVLQFDGMAFEQTAQTWQYELAHDTIIGGKEYTAVTRHWTAYDESAAEYVAAVRFAENKKAFIYYDNAEYLLYDFGYHEIGDTLEVFSGINNYEHFKTYKCVITDNYSTAGGIAEDTYVMDIIHPITGDTIPSALVWQEFVGSYSGFLHGGLLVPGNSNYQLLCAYKDNVLAYSVDNDAFADNDTFIEYGCEYNANDVNNNFNEPLIGQWRGVDRDLIVSISDSIISIEKIGLSHKYIASATQLQIERLWAQEDAPHRSANCDYWLHGDTLWIDSIVPSLAEIYPPIFGSITLVRVKNEELFPTLAGLQRTSCTKTIGEDEYGTVWGSRSYLMQETQTTTIDGKQYIVFGDEYDRFALREENNKILLYSSILKKDLVLYDFTLEVGDSLPALYFEWRAHDTMHQWLYIGDIVDYNKDDDGTILPAETFVVTDISTITLLDGKEYKKWTFDNGMEYVEGIGSFGTSYAWNDFYQLIANGPLYSDVHSQHLVCVSKNGKLLYQMDDAEMERLGAECLCEVENPEDLFPTLWGLQRTTFYHYTECSDSYSSLTASNEIVTINDKPYLRFGKMFLREENNQVLIYSAAYDKDLVLYDWNLEVGDSISLLAMDYGVYPEYAVSVVDYRVIVDVDENGDLITDTIPTDKVVVDKISTITLLDGKEYKTWHLATGWAGGITYVEGIGILSEGYGGGDYLGLIRPEELPTCYYGDLLVCVSKNNKLLYQMDPVKMDELGAECLCDYDRGPRKDNAKNGKIGGRPTPTQWNMLEVETKEMDGTPTILRAETFSYTLENDSIVTNGKTFYQLARQSTKDTAITKSFVGALHFGEDEDNRVYFLRDGVEYVLYDFTAELGDTIEIFAGINNYPQETTYTHVVTGKDTLENGACRMMLEVVFPEEIGSDLELQHLQKIWLAGLGSIDGIVHNAATRTSNAHAAPARSAHSSDTQISVMLCAWREDSCLYTTNHPEYDTFGCVYNQDPTAIENLTSPSSYQKIIHEGKLLILHEGKVYNVIGIQIK